MDNEQLVNDCNKVLRYLSKNMTSDWKDVLGESLTESEFETNIATITRKKLDPLGAIDVGTGTLADDCNLDTQSGREVIRALKDHNKILQCGRGRGKAVLVLDLEPIMSINTGQEATVVVEAPYKVAEAQISNGSDEETNVVNLLRKATDEYRSVHDQLTQFERTLRQRDEQIAKLESTLEDKEAVIASLESQLEETRAELKTKTITSWT